MISTSSCLLGEREADTFLSFGDAVFGRAVGGD